MSARTSPTGAASAALLYWLLVVCGLAGLTVLRFDTPNELVPLWLGTVVGVALGQLVAWLRVRAWLLAVVTMGALWFAPVFLFVVYQSNGSAAETCAFAFLPAAVCGYLSLSERGGLVAFWYPAVLWMLVILDGPVPGAFDVRTALPLMIGLGALFVAFLRARETRRVAIWHRHGSVRLATSLPRTVLRTSPLRTASQLAWTGLVGAAALVLAAWIAPHLWQKEQGKRARAAAELASETLAPGASGAEPPCCPDNGHEDEQRQRVREYFPLFHGERRPTMALSNPAACAVCRDGKSVASASDDASGGFSGGGSGGIAGGGSGGVSGGTSGGTYNDTPNTDRPTTSTSQATSPGTPPSTHAPTHVVEPGPAPTPTSTAAQTPRTRATASPRGATVGVVLMPAAPPPNPGAPWKSVLAFCLGGLGLFVAVRALRRQLTLRHLTRPFWAETLDQRISNHWQRMLIGLGDAGIRPALDEQPQALARRVGIDGMDTCATILERVRHGVRVDADDLEAMGSAAGAVYSAARKKAGLSGRAAALVRWPLA